MSADDEHDHTADPSASPQPSASPPSAAAVAPPPAPRLLSASHPRYAELCDSLKRISDECAAELRDELRSKQVDVGSVRDLLRFHLSRQLEVDAQLQQIDRDEATATDGSVLSLADSVLEEYPLVPASLRGRIWLLLLGCHNKDATLLDGFDADRITRQPRPASALRPAGAANDQDDEDAAAGPGGGISASLRASIRLDAQRTRRAMHSNDQLVSELETLLVYYCHARSVEYKQGLNEILAPILITLSQPAAAAETAAAAAASSSASAAVAAPAPAAPLVVPRGQVYNAFYALISKFLPSIFTDADLENLRCIFRLFRLLFLYHAPALHSLVETSGGVPAEVYATSWFLTLFAAQGGCQSLAALQRLWDAILIEDDHFLHYFVALALLRQNEDYLSQTPGKYLPMALRKLAVSQQNLWPLLREAKKMRARTPVSFRQALFEVSFAKMSGAAAGGNGAGAGGVGGSAPSAALSSHLLEQMASYSDLLPCMAVPASEVVQNAYSDLESRTVSADPSASEGQIKYIVLDTRPTAEYAAGHLPCAINISPSLLHIPSQLEALVGPRQYGGMKECHFVFIGSQASSFAEVQTPAPVGLAASTGPAAHALNLPASRRSVPPPSPSSSLAALSEAARAQESELEGKSMLAHSIPLKNLDESGAADGTETPVLGGSAASFPASEGHGLSVQIGSPLSANAAQSPSVSGVLYRPGTPGQSPLSSPMDLSAGDASGRAFASPSGSRGASGGVMRTNVLLDSATASYIHWFLSHGFSHVSVCEGGFPACHSLVFAAQAAFKLQREQIARGELTLSSYQTPLENMELVDHNSRACLVCNPPPVAAPPQPLAIDTATDGHHSHPSTPPEGANGQAAAGGAGKKDSVGATPEKDGGKKRESPAPKQTDTNAAGETDGREKDSSVKAGGKDDEGKEKDKDKAAAASAAPAASSLSKFSLGFKKLGASLSDKLAKFKEEQREKDREKAEKAEKEKIAAMALAAKADAAAATAAAAAAASPEAKATTPAADSGAGAKADDSKPSKEKEKEKEKDSKSLGSRFLAALQGVGKKKDGGGGRSSGQVSDAPVSELNAAVDLNDWAQDADNIALFHCHEISLFPTGPRANAPAASPSTPTTPQTVKRQGLLLPRVLAVTAGYILTFQPAKPPAASPASTAASSGGDSGVDVSSSPAAPTATAAKIVRATSSADDALLAAAENAGAGGFGLSFLKSKRRLIDLDKITSKKDRPSVLTFHWRDENAVNAAAAAAAAATAATPVVPAPLSAEAALSSTSPAPSPMSHNGFDAVALTPSSSFLPHQYPSNESSPSSSSAASSSAASSPAATAAATAAAAAASPRRSTARGATTMFLVADAKKCIALVRAKFLLAKASAALAESNKDAPTLTAAAVSVQPAAPTAVGSAAAAYSSHVISSSTPPALDVDAHSAESKTATGVSPPPVGSSAAAAVEALVVVTPPSLAPRLSGRQLHSPPLIVSPIGGLISPTSDEASDLLDL